MNIEERVKILESIFAQQDEIVNQLSQELYVQQQEITHLKNQIQFLKDKLDSATESGQIAGNERPPHY